jgi:hypothetical protein
MNLTTAPTPVICPMPPEVVLARLADSAIAKLADASKLVMGPQPFSVTLPPTFGGHPAVQVAREAIALIDQALSYEGVFPVDVAVLDAFRAARTQANEGVLQLTTPTLIAVPPAQIAKQFDTASMYLGIATETMGRGDRRFPIDPIRPPFEA